MHTEWIRSNQPCIEAWTRHRCSERTIRFTHHNLDGRETKVRIDREKWILMIRYGQLMQNQPCNPECIRIHSDFPSIISRGLMISRILTLLVMESNSYDWAEERCHKSNLKEISRSHSRCSKNTILRAALERLIKIRWSNNRLTSGTARAHKTLTKLIRWTNILI